MKNHKYKVAIVCKTYNHEKYISEAIESFLDQETDFSFQIIIHDDASTDKTPEIMRSYKEKHPHKIFPIYQKVNQYSKGAEGKETMHQQLVSLIDSEYVALCEGDDYWIDKNKLQKQVNFLDNNLEYSASTHRSKVFDESIMRFKKNTGSKLDVLTIEDMILGGGGIVPSASIFMRSKYYLIPQFGRNLSIGDWQIQIHVSLYGPIKNYRDVMAVYRTNVSNSWTSKYQEADIKKHSELILSFIIMLEELKLSYEIYDHIIELKIFMLRLNLFYLNINKYSNLYKKCTNQILASILSSYRCNQKKRVYRKFCKIVRFTKFYFLKS